MASRTRRYVVAFCIALLAVAAAWRWAHPPQARVSVYFIRAQASSSTVQDVTRTVQGRGPEALLAAAVRELLAGPTPAGRGSSSMLGRLWQIVYTATQFPHASRVRFLIEGQTRAALGGEGVVIDHPLARPASPPVF